MQGSLIQKYIYKLSETAIKHHLHDMPDDLFLSHKKDHLVYPHALGYA